MIPLDIKHSIDSQDNIDAIFREACKSVWYSKDNLDIIDYIFKNHSSKIDWDFIEFEFTFSLMAYQNSPRSGYLYEPLVRYFISKGFKKVRPEFSRCVNQETLSYFGLDKKRKSESQEEKPSKVRRV